VGKAKSEAVICTGKIGFLDRVKKEEDGPEAFFDFADRPREVFNAKIVGTGLIEINGISF